MSSPFGTLVLVVDRRASSVDPSTIQALVEERGLIGRLVDVGDGAAATEAAREAVSRGERFIVAVGDDGTIHDVANGMVDSEAPGVDRPILGVLPTTEHVDFIKTFGLPSDLRRAAGHLEGGGTFAIDAGKVSCAPLKGDSSRIQYFLNVAQAGLGAAMVDRAERLDRRFGRGAKFVAFWSTLVRFRPSRGRVAVDGRSVDERIRDVIVANGQFHRDGLMISPRSWPGDGLLDVLVMIGPRSEAFTELPKMYRGEHLPNRHVIEMKGRTATIETERPFVVEVDGRVLGRTPATFELIRQPLSVKI